MRSHRALEQLNRAQFRDDLGLLAAKQEKAKALLECAVSFDFAKICPEPEHTQFGSDLLSRHMLRLPFPIVLFSCGWGHYLAHMAKEGGPLYVASLTFTPDNLGCVSTEVEIIGDRAAWWHIGRSVPKHISDGMSEDHAAAEACLSGHIVCGLVAILLGRDVEKVHRPPSPALLKQRRRKGKPLINDAYEIKIRPHVVTNADGSGRTHASPRTHWRRGSYRRLTNPERLIPIPPCLVNGAEDAKLMFPNPRDYILASNVEWQRTRIESEGNSQ